MNTHNVRTGWVRERDCVHSTETDYAWNDRGAGVRPVTPMKTQVVVRDEMLDRRGKTKNR